MEKQATPTARIHAKTLRREMTDSERRLWSGLRSEQLGVKFRRQHPLGTYIADVACLAPKWIVELDGSQHAQQRVYDLERDAFFMRQGFEVLRFASNEPFINLTGVLQAIANRLEMLMATQDSVSASFQKDCRKKGGAMAPSPSGGGSGWGPAAVPLVTAAGPHPHLPPEGEGAKAFCASFQRAKE
jgi:very-short-patch-repair endonuclease